MSSAGELPIGTVTFLFTDIEGSTLLERELRERYSEVLAEHRRLLRDAFGQHGGHEVDTQGDSFFVVFARARDAVAAAVAAQRVLAAHAWPDARPVRVRIGMHTGEASLDDGRYVGLAVHRGARISAAGHGGQILLSSSTRDVVEDDLPADQRLIDLGENRLKDLPRPERVFQLVADSLSTEFPPLKTVDEQELAEAAEAAVGRRPRVGRRRLVAGGAGATVLAAAVAAVAIVLLLDRGGETRIDVAPNSVAVIDSTTNRVVDDIGVGQSPTAIAVGEGAAWVLNGDDRTVSRVDLRTKSVRTLSVGGGIPTDLAVGDGAVWVVDGFAAVVSRIDAQSGALERTIRLPGAREATGNSHGDIAFSPGGVWVSAWDIDRFRTEFVWRIDPRTNRVVKTFPDRGGDVAVDRGSVWVVSTQAAHRIDARSNAVATLDVVLPYPQYEMAVATGATAIWITGSLTNTLTKVGYFSEAVERTITVGSAPSGVTVGRGAVWVANTGDGTVMRINPLTARIVRTIAVGRSPAGIAVDGNQVWVAVS